MRFTTLEQWLSWQETLHPETIELGLERISQVFQRLHSQPPGFPVITVAGTNGKGSSVALLETIYQSAGYRTGVYSSPHLLRYNERVHLDGQEVTDDQLCEAFARVDAARLAGGEAISLTYFEFGTLAALDIFYRQAPDVVILEVGLGGRLDAVNIIDADVALITSISIDHAAWLGNDRESIGREKAGIMRAQRPVVFSGREIPGSVRQQASQLGAQLFVLGEDYSWQLSPGGWQWQSADSLRSSLPHPALRGDHQLDNAAGVLKVVELLASQRPVNQQQLKKGLLDVRLAGRFQVFPGDKLTILDVAHNPDGTRQLAKLLASHSCQGQTLAVMAMLQDKDHFHSLQPLTTQIDHWLLAALDVPRASQLADLAGVLQQLGVNSDIQTFPSVALALQAAQQRAGREDRIIVFGSFYTVAEALAALSR